MEGNAPADPGTLQGLPGRDPRGAAGSAAPGHPPEAGIPPHTVFNFAVVFGEDDERVGTAVVRGSHREGWTTGPASHLPAAAAGYPGLAGRLEVPEASILLFDAATLHRGPPAGPDPAAGRTLFFMVKPCAMSAGLEATVREDMGAQTPRFPVRD